MVDIGSGLDSVDGETERPRRAVANRPDDLVHPAPAGGDERLGRQPEDGRQAVGAQPGVLAGAAVVDDRHLLADIGIEVVGDPLRIFGAVEPVGQMTVVAPWLGLRPSAAAQPRRARRFVAVGHGNRLSEPVDKAHFSRHFVGPVVGHLDRRAATGVGRVVVGMRGHRVLLSVGDNSRKSDCWVVRVSHWRRRSDCFAVPGRRRLATRERPSDRATEAGAGRRPTLVRTRIRCTSSPPLRDQRRNR